jgi:methyl-accepting chemotaxis protein
MTTNWGKWPGPSSSSRKTSLESLADGDLTVRLKEDFPPEFADLKLNFNRTMEQLEATISQVVETANWLNENVALVGDATTQLSRRNENQAAAIEETSAASSALSNSVQETSAHAMKARTFAGNTRQSAANGAKTVEDTTRAMDRIQASSEKISAIIGLIEDVAFQTNLLALNAGVEAARAGDAGRGFAVVASEVGALSRRSAEAVSEIREIISQALEDVSAGVETVGQAGVSIREIGDMVDQISTLIEDISDATTEQSDSLSSTNASVKQIDAMTQENAAMSEETAATARSLADGAKSLLDVTAQFKHRSGGGALTDACIGFRDVRVA